MRFDSLTPPRKCGPSGKTRILRSRRRAWRAAQSCASPLLPLISPAIRGGKACRSPPETSFSKNQSKRAVVTMAGEIVKAENREEVRILPARRVGRARLAVKEVGPDVLFDTEEVAVGV